VLIPSCLSWLIAVTAAAQESISLPRADERAPICVRADAAEHWRLERMNVMDRLILRLAVYEFLHEPATPGKVIINEALELARSFSGDESVGFINGILDAIRRTLARE